MNEIKITFDVLQNNVAHSNGEIGIGMFNRLSEDHGIIGCSTYRPTDNPKAPRKANLVPVEFNGITVYKNGKVNGRFRATTVKVNNYRSAYAQIGILFERNMVDGFQQLEDAYIVGVEDGQDYRSRHGQIGVKLHIEGPVHLKDVTLKNLKDGIESTNGRETTPACGIKFGEAYRFVMGPTSTAENININDIGEASVLCANMKDTATTQSSIQLRDLDGSLTGSPMSSLVFRDGDLIENQCEFNEEWNLSVCKPEFKFVNVSSYLSY